MNRTIPMIVAAGLTASNAAALPDQTTWSDFYPTVNQLCFEQPLGLETPRGIWSNRLSNDLPIQVMDDFQVVRDGTVDEIVFYGYAYHEEQERWALLSENISAFTVEIFSNHPDAYAGGCHIEPDVLLASKSVWRSQAEGPLTGDLSEDGSFLRRLSITLDEPLRVLAGQRYGLRITGTVMDSNKPVGFKWATTDEARFGSAFDSAALDCSPAVYFGGPVYADGMAFELAGPTSGEIIHRQLANHDTPVVASTTNSTSDTGRRYDDFVAGFDGRIDAVTFYATACWNRTNGASFFPEFRVDSMDVAVHEVVEHANGSWEPGELVGRTTLSSSEMVRDNAFRQRVSETSTLDREWYRYTVDMNPPVPVAHSRRYALSVAGEMVQPSNSIVFAWGGTLETSLQDSGLPAITVDRETGAVTEDGVNHAFTVHGLSTPWCGVADIAEPFGLLDLADINAFVAAFTSQGNAADLNGDGIKDLSDISRFIESFIDGCPTID